MNKVYSPFYTAKQCSDGINRHDGWEPGLTRVVTFHCPITGKETASRYFLQWNRGSSGDGQAAVKGCGVFSSPIGSSAWGKDADAVGSMLSTFLLHSPWQGIGATTPAQRVHSPFACWWRNSGNNQAACRLYLPLGKSFPARSQSNQVQY